MLQLRGACVEELDKAAVCIGAAFTHDDPVRIPGVVNWFNQRLTTDTHFAVENTRLALIDGHIVSVVHIADRHVYIDGVPMRCGVVTAVGTLPSYQQHGYASLLLWDAAEYMTRQGYDLSLVHGEGRESFYERAGWRNFQHYYKCRIKLSTLSPECEFQGEIRSGDCVHDLEAVMAIYTHHNPYATGPAVWTREFWREYAAQWDKAYPLFWVAFVDGRPCAYLRNGKDCTIVEVGAFKGAEKALEALILHACRSAQQAGQEEICALDTLPVSPEWKASGWMVRREKVSGQLYRILNLRSLLNKLLPRMQERWVNSACCNWVGSLRIESEVGCACVNICQGDWKVAETANSTAELIHLRLTHAQTINLIMGQASLDDLLLSTTGTWESAQQIVRTLFPAHEYRWYPKDGF